MVYAYRIGLQRMREAMRLANTFVAAWNYPEDMAQGNNYKDYHLHPTFPH